MLLAWILGFSLLWTVGALLLAGSLLLFPEWISFPACTAAPGRQRPRASCF
jgi:hypothetical protein